MNKIILITGTILGALSIALGAFGAHGLKALLPVEALQTFETGVRYQMYHAILLLFVGTTNYISRRTKKIVFYFVLLGLLFFSGSIYGLATNSLSVFDFKSIGFVTPVGGILLILAWGFMLKGFLKDKKV